jgi:plasmid maintenance system antidote protein VapI
MHVRPPFMSKIVNGHAHITPKVALKLEAATGVNASIWAGYETEYALARARDHVQN